MNNALVLAQVMGPFYLVLGLSVLLYGKVWQKVLSAWVNDHYSMVTLMFMYVILGLIVINMYNVWAWNVWLLVTITGWCLFVKGLFYFLMPGSVIKKVMEMKSNLGFLHVGGAAALLIGLALSYYTYLV